MMQKILQITDLHITPRSGDRMLGIDTEAFFQQTLAHAHHEQGPFDLILVTGDLAQDPCADSYHRIQQHLNLYRTPCLCLPGNHDDWPLMQSILDVDYVRCDKRLRLGNWLIMMLNTQKTGSAIGALSREELSFLQETLQSHADSPTLLAMHHHCLPSGAAWLDTMQIENSAALLSILDNQPQVKAISSGHVHQAASTQRGQSQYFATPATCFQFTPYSTTFSLAETPPGYRTFELYDDGRLTSKVHHINKDMRDLQRQIDHY